MATSGGRVVTLDDGKGGRLLLYNYEDLWLPAVYHQHFDVREHLKRIKNITYKKGDVLHCGYPKSGNHWFVNLLTLLRNPDIDLEHYKTVNMNIIDIYKPKHLAMVTCPRTLSSHFKMDRLPVDLVKNSIPILLIVRNPKDVAVSLYYHMKNDHIMSSTLSWDAYLQCFLDGKVLYGSYFEYLNAWQRLILEKKITNVHIFYYEDLVEKPLNEMKRLQRVIETSNSESRIEAIIERCHIRRLRSDVISGKTHTFLVDHNKKPYIYRKGEIGDWRSHFTVEQNDSFDSVISDKLQNSLFTFRYLPRIHTARL